MNLRKASTVVPLIITMLAAGCATDDDATIVTEPELAVAGTAAGDERLDTAEPLTISTPLLPGTRYLAGGLATDLDITLEVTDEGLFGSSIGGTATIDREESGAGTVLAMFDADLVLLLDPTADPSANPDALLIGEPIADDALAQYADRPGVQAEPVEETTIAGYPARRMGYVVTAVPGTTTCFPADPRACHTSFVSPGGQTVWADQEGDTPTLYEVRVGARRILILAYDVNTADRLLASLQIEPVLTTDGIPPLPAAGALVDDEVRSWTGSSIKGSYRVTGVDGVDVLPPGGRNPSVVFGTSDGGNSCMSLADGVVESWAVSSIDEAIGATEFPPPPTDAVAALAARPDVFEITRAPAVQDFAGVDAQILEVRSLVDYALITLGGVTIERDQVARIALIPRGDGYVDVVAVIVGTPCEPMFTTVEFIPD